MSDIPDEAVRAAWGRLDRVTHTLTEDDVHDALADALPSLLRDPWPTQTGLALARVKELEAQITYLDGKIEDLLVILASNGLEADYWRQRRKIDYVKAQWAADRTLPGEEPDSGTQ